MKKTLCFALSIVILMSLLCGCTQGKKQSLYVAELIHQSKVTESSYTNYTTETREYTFSDTGLPTHCTKYADTDFGWSSSPWYYTYDDDNLLPILFDKWRAANPKSTYYNLWFKERYQGTRKLNNIPSNANSYHISLNTAGYPTGIWYNDENFIIFTYDSSNNSVTEDHYQGNDSTQSVHEFNSDNRLIKTTRKFYKEGKWDSFTDIWEYSYASSADTNVSYSTENYSLDYYDDDGLHHASPMEQITYTYDQNGIAFEGKGFSSEGNYFINYQYKYKRIDVPADAIPGLCQLYNYLSIPYVIDDGTVTVEDTYFPDGEHTGADSLPTVANTEKEYTLPPESITQGAYTLEEASERTGFYLAYEDGSFDRYAGGGYCVDHYNGNIDFSGMFMSDNISNSLPTIDTNTKLVFFADNYQTLTLRSVNGSVSALSVEAGNGTKGFAYIDRINEYGASLLAYYKGSGWGQISPHYINGVPSQDYEAIHFTETVHPYSGMSSQTAIIDYFSFEKGSTVTLAIAEGSKLVEKNYPANITYFDCMPNGNNYWIEDQHYLYPTPTADGYAQIDFSGIPDGQYVMYLDLGTSYIATVVSLQQS